MVRTAMFFFTTEGRTAIVQSFPHNGLIVGDPNINLQHRAWSKESTASPLWSAISLLTTSPISFHRWHRARTARIRSFFAILGEPHAAWPTAINWQLWPSWTVFSERRPGYASKNVSMDTKLESERVPRDHSCSGTLAVSSPICFERVESHPGPARAWSEHTQTHSPSFKVEAQSLWNDLRQTSHSNIGQDPPWQIGPNAQI